MKINGIHYRTIWPHPSDERTIRIIDQRHLPHRFVVEDLVSVQDVFTAIRDMHVRGAGLIGATAGYGMYLAALEASDSKSIDECIEKAAAKLKSARPTAVNLSWAVDKQLEAISTGTSAREKISIALQTAKEIADSDAEYCRRIGEHGVMLIENISRRKGGKPVNILTHCNAGWLAFVDHGSATAPIYAAHDKGIAVHVWVDETRPRNQGAALTCWELGNHGVPHTLITDNAGGYLMQQGQVDLVIVGSDRTTYTGDVANKVGTYLKALAAYDNNIPFYVALPSSTIDWETEDGVKEIPIEQRDPDEVKLVEGWCEDEVKKVRICPENTPAANYAFDITPARLVTGLITERGICNAHRDSILKLFPEKQKR
ncbi:MAG: S-methyl-5-thioribose-1-phosphate isomerase [Bacteroidetes bacterium]|nr:MAG: S-methyl-5-thioribose-1-phosphate isomerase [Bacteroidota bacterium]